MRFRATLSQVGLLKNVLLSQVSIGKICLIKLTPESVRLVCLGDAQSGNAQVWTELPVDSIFENYILSSSSENTIYIEVGIDALLRAVKSSSEAADIGIRLCKKAQEPVLTFVIEHAATNNHRLVITQDVPCTVFTQSDLSAYQDPKCYPPDISITLPPLSDVRVVTERLKNLSKDIEIAASESGDFSLKIAGEGVRIETQWSGLKVNEYYGTDCPRASIQLDVKAFHRLLQAHHFSTRTHLQISHKRNLILTCFSSPREDPRDPIQNGAMIFILGHKMQSQN